MEEEDNSIMAQPLHHGTVMKSNCPGLLTATRALTGYTRQHTCIGAEQLLNIELPLTVLCNPGA